MKNKYIKWFCVLGLCFASLDLYAQKPNKNEPTGKLSLKQALSLVLEKNPELATFSAEIRSSDAQILQAKTLPNPQVSLEFENIAGSGNFEGFDSAETTLQLSQIFELGGKRKIRIRSAEQGRMLAESDYKAKRLRLSVEATKRFIETLVAQNKIIQASKTIKLTEDFMPDIQKRIEAGKASDVEKTRGELATTSAKIQLFQAQRDFNIARKRLSALWGNHAPKFTAVQGNLNRIVSVPIVGTLREKLQSNPKLTRFIAELNRRQAKIDTERAKATPDLRVGLGYRRFNDNDENAVVLNFSLPLPLFNKNKGNIAKAEAEFEKTRLMRKVEESKLNSELITAYEILLDAQQEIETLKTTLLPSAEKAYQTINKGYASGRFNHLELMEAQRTLTTAKIQLLSTQGLYHTTLAEIEGLTGTPINKF